MISLLRTANQSILILVSVIALSQCNSKKEKTTKPVVLKDLDDPSSAVYSDDQKREIVDLAMIKLKRLEEDADKELNRRSEARQQYIKERDLRRAESARITPEKARADFKGTKFTSIKLSNGDTFNKVTVIEATDIGVTISYEHGARRIKYADLPESIQERCMYTTSKKL